MATEQLPAYSNIRMVKDEEGNWCLSATQRPDGSWRKPIKVRLGYTPEELQEKYVIKSKRGGGFGKSPEPAALEKSAESTPEALEKLPEPTTEALQFDTLRDSDSKMASLNAGGTEAGTGQPRTGVRPIAKRTLPALDLFVTHLVPDEPQEPKPAQVEVKVPLVSKVTGKEEGEACPGAEAASRSDVAPSLKQVETPSSGKWSSHPKKSSPQESMSETSHAKRDQKELDQELHSLTFRNEAESLEEINKKLKSVELSDEQKVMEWNTTAGTWCWWKGKKANE